METTCRPAVANDLAQIVALDRKIFGEDGADEDPAIIAARLQVFPAGCVVIARGHEVLGYLTCEKWGTVREPALDEDPRQTHEPQGRVLNITTLAVDPAVQGAGLGGRLVAEAIAIARREGCTQIVLETARAAAFYTRHGFTQIGERTQRNIRLYILSLDLTLV